MKYIFFTFLFISSIIHAQVFSDNFTTDTSTQYTTEDTWTQGGVGSFTYDSAGERIRLLTGDNIALTFSGDLASSTEGSFSIDFLPTQYYPNGGWIILKLIEDASTYYMIENSDNYGAGMISKYVNDVNVDTYAFSSEYTQNNNYTITVTFSPASTTVQAFGETLTINSDTSGITVNSFSVQIGQQDAYFDNIVYSIAQAGGNTPPVADAGLDQSIQVNQSVTITGTGNDSDGNVTEYEWKKDGNNTVLATTASFSYTPGTVGIDTLTLTVTDNNGSTGTDSMNVTVTAAPVPNTAPIADAGIDQSVNTNSTVTLDGSGSSDIDDDPLTYQWVMITKPVGSSATLSASATSAPTFVTDMDGDYLIELVVNDGEASSIADSVMVTATTLQSITAYTDNFTTDTSTQYTTEDTWTQGGVGSFTYDSAGERIRLLTGDNIALTFSGDLASSTEGSFSIDFLPTQYYPNGGWIILKLIEDASTYYMIENSDNYGAGMISKYVNDVNVDTYAFSSEYTQNNNYTITVTFSPASTTVQAFGETLTINSDTSGITVNSFSVQIGQQDAYFDNIVYSIAQAGGNTPPVADAGLDQSIQVNQSVTITGTGNDSDGNVTEYEWKKDGNNTVLATTASFSYTPGTVGIDTLTLTVTDNNGSTGTDSMNVTVTAAPVPNTAPIADAGIDQSVNTNSTVTLDGSGSSDIDDDPLTYQWVMITKPVGSSATLSASATSAPTFVTDMDGDYLIELVVNDGEASSIADSVMVTATTLQSITAYTDNFTTDTSTQYTTEDTWTQGGVGSFTYDSAGERIHLLTGDNIALTFSGDLASSTEGSFSIDFLPTQYYPNGGWIILKLIEDASTYYMIENSDNYGAGMISKYVNDVNVDTYAFSSEYTQNNNYTITVTFSPASTTVQAFGETLTINSDTSGITVNSFSVQIGQQDAYFDNIVYSIAQAGGNTPPVADAGLDQSIQVNQSVTITGTGNDSDGNVTEYEWKKDGNNTVLATTASFSYTPGTVGIDTLTLTVTDNNGSTGTDSMNVTVTAAPVPNTAPIADAGIDQSVNTNSTVTLDGSGSSDIDDDPLTYQWVMITKPVGSSATLSASATSAPTFVTDMDGDYLIELVVNDGEASSIADSVMVTATTLQSITAYTDNFTTDTSTQYTTEDTWTQGGVGSFTYDSAGERIRLLTGDNIALTFSGDLASSTEGSFSIDFLPTVKYPTGGFFILKLIQDASTYYRIENTDGYGAKEISKYVNGVNVDTYAFSSEYTQNNNYTITVTFSPTSTTVQAFGETLTINSDTSGITVNSFSVQIGQQDAYFDNIVYTVNTAGLIPIQIISPESNDFQSERDLTIKVLTNNLATGWGVKFVLDEGDVGEQMIIDKTLPYNVSFTNVARGEHRIDCYIVDDFETIQLGDENHDSASNIIIGDTLIAFGDSITFGYGDDLIADDISADGRNTGGGFEPILNDHLSGIYGYPHSIINEGISGERTQEGLARLPSVLTKHTEASTFIVLYGTNDTTIGTTLESGKGLNIGDIGYDGTYKDYMQQIIDLVNSSGKKIAIAKIPFAIGESSYRNVKARDFNEVIDELVADTSNNIGVTPPDLYNHFSDINIYSVEYFDNIHPNGLGYRSIADLWRDALIE